MKADIKHYFDTVDHTVLLKILRRKIRDEEIIWLVIKILNNFEGQTKGKGMPLGNYTSQFFANVYLNELDYFVKHTLKARRYIRYVDDFVILHKRKKILELYKTRISNYLHCLNLELHPHKSSVMPLKGGTTFLGYRIFYHYKLLRKRNLRTFQNKFERRLLLYKKGGITKDALLEKLQGWFGYAQWANTHKFRQKLLRMIDES